MATILFTWELGKGSGHIAPYINLIKKLEADGHRIFFAVRCLGKAYRLFADTDVNYLQAPVFNPPACQLMHPVDSYTKILNNHGYAEPTQIAGMIKAWKNLFSSITPDLVIFDFSPTALLAARDCSFQRLIIGTGFFTPSENIPTTGLHILQGGKQDQQQLLAFENTMLENINQALLLNHLPLLNYLYDIHQAEACLFTTFAELDHYPDRKNGHYIGVSHSPPGLTPEWPDHAGKRVFIYLSPFPTLPALLELLNHKQLPTLAYITDLPAQTRQQFSSSTLTFVDRPLDMDSIGLTADIAICNGNHGTLLELLLSGIPVLSLPLHAEQNIISRNVEKTGAGLTAAQKTHEEIEAKLNMLLEDTCYKNAALAFAERHKDFDPDDQVDQLINTINNLLTQAAE